MVGEIPNYRTAFLLYVLLFLALSAPCWERGLVVAPHLNCAELGLPQSQHIDLFENRKFSDYSLSFIPELDQLIHRSNESWLPTWTAQNELGRPLYHLSGFSPAYFPSLLCMKLKMGPYRFLTVITLSLCFLAGLFVFLYCRELQFDPRVGVLAAGGFASCPLFMYWLTFPMFLAVPCWSAGILFALVRLFRTIDLLGWCVLVFSVYSLLMTGYPQPIVFHAYILAGYALVLVHRLRHHSGTRAVALYLAAIASAALVGGTCALPVYLDLAHTVSQSARGAPNPTFFLAALPAFYSFADFSQFLATSTFPEFLGAPISAEYPFNYNGVSLTPLLLFLAVVSGANRIRECWGWWVAVGLLCALALIHPLYLVGVNYLGFNLSRSTPLGSLAIPVTVIAAHGAEALAKRSTRALAARGVLLSVAMVCGALAFAVAFGLYRSINLRWETVASTLLVVACCLAQVRSTRFWLLLAALGWMGAYLSRPLMLLQNPSQIAHTSPFVETVRRNLPPDSRFAIARPGIAMLPPNLSATLDLPSIHSYDSLSPRRYHRLIKALDGDLTIYGRWNDSISPDYGGDDFWMSNVGLVLSPQLLDHPNLSRVDESAGVQLYRVNSRMGNCWQVARAAATIAPDGAVIGKPQELPRLDAGKVQDCGDFVEFNVTETDASLLVLSQLYHRDWQATVLQAQHWVRAATLPVNNVFQGIVLPKGAQRVVLRFEPFVRHSWIGHLFFVSLLLLLALRGASALSQRFRSSEPARK